MVYARPKSIIAVFSSSSLENGRRSCSLWICNRLFPFAPHIVIIAIWMRFISEYTIILVIL